jgi:hypothetical protein
VRGVRGVSQMINLFVQRCRAEGDSSPVEVLRISTHKVCFHLWQAMHIACEPVAIGDRRKHLAELALGRLASSVFAGTQLF